MERGGIGKSKRKSRNISTEALSGRLSPIREDTVVRIITLEDHFATPMFQERFPQGNVPGHFLADRGRYLGYDISAELLNLGDSRLAAMDAAGIDVQNGAVTVDRHLRTTNPQVYAAGDVTGAVQFTHYARWQGFVAARNALLPGAQEGMRSSVPWAVFTDPEVAQAGLTEAEARSQLREIKVHRLPLERVDRAQTEGRTDGFLKLVSQADGKVVGATVVSRAAGETVNELSLAIDRGLTVSELASTIHVYPTFSFAVQQLAAEVSLEAATSGARGRMTRALRHLS